MSKTVYQSTFKSTIEAVGTAINGALAALVEHGWCTMEDSFCIRLCIEEALVNAVVHGNKNEAHLEISLTIADEGDLCRIRVRDQGEGFDPDAVTMPDCDQLGGRGVCLIKHYMDEVKFDIAGRCLEMTFRRSTFSCEEEETNVT